MIMKTDTQQVSLYEDYLDAARGCGTATEAKEIVFGLRMDEESGDITRQQRLYIFTILANKDFVAFPSNDG